MARTCAPTRAVATSASARGFSPSERARCDYVVGAGGSAGARSVIAPAATAHGAAFASQRRVHELALMEGMVDAVLDRLGDERIAAVHLAIGKLAGVDVEALRFCFEVCAKDTTLAGATLEIRAIDPRARCRSCGVEHAPRSLASPCPCGSFDRELIAGDELRLEEVEIY